MPASPFPPAAVSATAARRQRHPVEHAARHSRLHPTGAAAVVPSPAALTLASASRLQQRSNAQVVARARISDALCESAARLLLLEAPAGFGKTTAMLQCQERMQAAGVATVWLTLDRADNDLSRFVSNLEAALERLGMASARPGSPHDLVRAIAAFAEPFAVFLDDFEAVQEPVVLGLVQEVLGSMPPEGRLVVGTRSVLPLDLGRMRVRGQVAEVGVESLRFDRAECATFLRAHGHPELRADVLEMLHRRTEGWAAGLWLASMSMRRSGDAAGFIARFSGSERAIADYLAQDVLAQQSSERQTFLLCTSILRELDADLCHTLCPQFDCGRMLAQLAADNLFVASVDARAGRWRYHSLFAGFLRARLREMHPQVLPQLHVAASRWYEEQERPVPAVDHALEARDWPRALALVARHAQSLLEGGRMRLLARWFAALPPSLLRRHNHPQVLGFWAVCFTRGPWEAAQQIAESPCVRSSDPRVQANLAAMRPLLLAMQDRYQEAYVAGLASLKEVSAGSSFARSVLFNAMADIFCVLGNPREAHRLLDGARAARGDDRFNRMYTESREGMLDLLAGRLRHAKARLRMAVDATHAVDAAHAVDFNHAHGNAWAGVLYACVAYEADERDRAERMINVYLPMAREVGLPDHMILSHAMRARIAFLAGDVDRALDTLAELEDIGCSRKLQRVVVGARLERARLLLQQGQGEASCEELERANVPEIWERERSQRLLAHDLDYFTAAQLRWTLAFGDAGSALAPLTRELEAARLGGRHRRALRLQLLRAIAQQAAGQPEAALDSIAQVLQTSAQEGYVRSLLDEGPAAALLVQRYVDSGAAHKEPMVTEHVGRLLRAFGHVPGAAPDASAIAVAEALTGKEIRVLELLAEGYSNGMLASKLCISDSTVRTHLRNVNQKLRAKSRTHAVALARRRGLIR